MKAYVLHVLVIDHDELGAAEVKAVLENNRYPNDCMSPEVLGSVEHEIGEWSDDHPLNQVGVDAGRWLRAREGQVRCAREAACAHQWQPCGDWGDERCPLCDGVRGPTVGWEEA